MSTNSAHEEFLKQYKVFNENPKILQMSDYLGNNNLEPEDRISKAEERYVIEEWSKSFERQKRQKRENERKRILRMRKQEKRAKWKGNIKKVLKVVLPIMLAAIVVGEGKNMYDTYQQQNAPIVIEQALENGETLDSLGIDNNLLLEMQDIEEMLERDDLTNEEIIALAPRIRELQSDTLEMKLSNTLGVAKEDISFDTQPIEEGQTRESVKIRNGETYYTKDIFTHKNTIPPLISNSIKENDEMRSIERKVKEGDIDRGKISEKYKDVVTHTSQLAASKMKVDENRNITAEYTKVSDLNNQQNEVKTASIDEEPEL